MLTRDLSFARAWAPEVYEELCTRRVLVSEWIDGVKLSACDPQVRMGKRPSSIDPWDRRRLGEG